MTPGSFLFLVCSGLCLAGALIVVLAKNPIRGAMGLLTTIIGIAGLFLRLNAQFLAAMQLLVYAGAVVILFVFVVMLLGPSASIQETHRTSSTNGALVSRAIAGGVMVLVGLGSLVAFSGLEPTQFDTIGPEHGSVAAVGRLIFTQGLVPFELATVLLIVAVVGAIGVARTKPSTKKPTPANNPTLRMFHGPLHPRDAERPLSGKTLAESAGAAAGSTAVAGSTGTTKEIA